MPEENTNAPVSTTPENKSSVLDKPVPNPLAQNPNVHTHKVFAAIGLILIGTIIAVAGIWWNVNNNSGTSSEETSTTKVATDSAKKDEVADWKVYKTDKVSFEYPATWFSVNWGEGNSGGFGSVIEISNYEFSSEDYAPLSPFRNRDDYQLVQYSYSGSTEEYSSFKTISSLKVGETTKADYLGAPSLYKRGEDLVVSGYKAYSFTIKRSVSVDDNNTQRDGYYLGMILKDPKPELQPYEYHSLHIMYYQKENETEASKVFNKLVATFKFL